MTDTVDAAFEQALNSDAGLPPEGQEIPMPPRRSATVDPDAPHGRDEAGQPNAPYGIGSNGRPRIKPAGPGRGKSRDEKPRTAKPGAKVPTPQTDGQRKDGVRGLVQIGAGIAILLDSRTPPEHIAFRADALTLAEAADPIAEACTDVARENAQFAAVIDKITAAGPYAALITVSLQVGSQLARNHGARAAEMFGAQPPELLLQRAAEQAAQEAGQDPMAA